MKRTLQGTSIVLLLAALVFWAVSGHNTGWTKNKVQVKIVDPVTGTDGFTFEKKFVPGVDFLAAALIASGLLAGASFLIRERNSKK